MKLKSYLAIAVFGSATDEVSPAGRVINPMDTPSTFLCRIQRTEQQTLLIKLWWALFN